MGKRFRIQGLRLVVGGRLTHFAMLARRPLDLPLRRAFTLIEMLVVMALIAVLTALLAPALQGLMGTSGRRGGMNTASAVIEQARLAAVESGTNAYVGFPITAKNKTNAYSYLIVYRDPSPLNIQETNRMAVSRWQRLPSGVFFEMNEKLGALLVTNTLVQKTLPLLAGNESMEVIPSLVFNRFGQLQGATSEVFLRVGDKIDPTQQDKWLRDNNYFELRIQPLTGRVIVDDAADPNQ